MPAPCCSLGSWSFREATISLSRCVRRRNVRLVMYSVGSFALYQVMPRDVGIEGVTIDGVLFGDMIDS